MDDKEVEKLMKMLLASEDGSGRKPAEDKDRSSGTSGHARIPNHRTPAEERARAILREAVRKFTNIDYIRPEDIPDIPLYMDQITTFMDSKLAACKRYPDDKILTKTMINNYTKNKLLPPPVKKKYSQEHLLLLIFVYYLKDFLSINDIKTILGPMEDNHFQTEDGLTLSQIYREIFEMILGQSEYMTKDIIRRFDMAKHTFPEAAETCSEEDSDYLKMFSFVCLLSFDVYVKKKLIEEVVDQMNAVSARREEAEKAAEEAKKRAAKENAERAKAEAEAKKRAAKEQAEVSKAAAEAERRAMKESAEKTRAAAQKSAAKPADMQGTADRNIEKNRTEN